MGLQLVSLLVVLLLGVAVTKLNLPTSALAQFHKSLTSLLIRLKTTDRRNGMRFPVSIPVEQTLDEQTAQYNM